MPGPLTKTFTLYRSSAGSGKTRTLAKEYLKLALRFRADYFKHILAVTFANKATQEMKDRILAYLDDFANAKPSRLAEELKSELNLDDNTFQQYAQEAQAEILHKYGQFSISTIDAFFQKVIRSFTREAGLVGDYRLEVEHDEVMEEVINNLIDELGKPSASSENSDDLANWVVEFAKENLENERAWDVRYSLIEFSKEIFREDFKHIEDEVISTTHQKAFFKKLLQSLQEKKYSFINTIRSRAGEAMRILHDHGLKAGDFKYAGGVYNFFRKFAALSNVKSFDEKEKGKRAENEFLDVHNWPDKATPHRSLIVKLANEKLLHLLNEIVSFRNKNFTVALSAEVALNNFYAFGLVADISRKLKEYKDENNVMMLADAPKFLNGVIRDSDTPFIYEKVGSFYRNYLIDEFQDTSSLQWKNFLPLLLNGLDQGYQSFVVGDVKQAIYRWRGGDLNLLQHEIEKNIGRERVAMKELNSNFRSASAIVDFNNALFPEASSIVSAETGHVISSEVYNDIIQKTSSEEQGFVYVRFLQEERDGPGWKEQALDEIPLHLERLQALGIPLKDIAILVRRNEEGQQIVSHLLQYKNSEKARPEFLYDVVSNESLRLDGAASVNLLLGAMKYLLNPDDDIARAQLAFEFARMHEPTRVYTEVFAVTNHTIFESYLPLSFTRDKVALKKLPLYELAETLIEIFKLGHQQGELAYLQAFQNLVLDFYSRERNDLGAFLEWWEANKHKKSIQVSGDVNAVQILTVHKAKGLQFKYVIVPFCAWSLDHEMMRAPQLWVKSDQPPFDQAGYLPVRYSGTLEETVFHDYYREERTRVYLDNLNLLYVALTRAEYGLMVLAPHPEIRNMKKTVAQLVYQGIQLSEDLQNKFKNASNEFLSGIWSAQEFDPSKEANTTVSTLSLAVYPSSSWRDKLIIRQSGKGYFDTRQIDKHEKINYGLHLHAVLSRIRYAEEIPSVLSALVREGLLSEAENQIIAKQLDELLQNKQIASWFSNEWDVRTEVPILLADGVESRIDRLILKEKKAIVVDFKTGEPTKADQKQVQDYSQILRKMNFVDIEAFLLYIRTGEVVAVIPPRSKVVRKKNENQLELGI